MLGIIKKTTQLRKRKPGRLPAELFSLLLQIQSPPSPVLKQKQPSFSPARISCECHGAAPTNHPLLYPSPQLQHTHLTNPRASPHRVTSRLKAASYLLLRFSPLVPFPALQQRTYCGLALVSDSVSHRSQRPYPIHASITASNISRQFL